MYRIAYINSSKGKFLLITFALFLFIACKHEGRNTEINPPPFDRYVLLQERMVEQQIKARGVRDQRVLEVMRRVPRHIFVPAEERDNAYDDRPLPIGYGQNLYQPYIVGLMAELMQLRGGERVLEIGTGSGYQAAVLSGLAAEVYSIEIVRELAEKAQSTLKEAGCHNVWVRWGDGYAGWPEKAPFAAIMVTVATDRVPEKLVDELEIGGRLVIPLGNGSQDLLGNVSQDLFLCVKTSDHKMLFWKVFSRGFRGAPVFLSK